MAHAQVLRPSYWYQKLVPVTLLVCHAFWHQIFLVPETWAKYDNVLFVTWNLDARDSNAALLLGAEICIFMIHRTRSLQSANKLALLTYLVIIIALILITLINAVKVRKKTHNN